MIAHRAPLSGVAAFGDRFIASAGYDNRVILWDQRSKEPLASSTHDHLANQCTFSPDGRFLATSSSDYSARLWSVPDLRLVAVLGDHDDDVEMCVFHPHEELIATASRDHAVRVYDFRGALEAVFRGHTADVISVAWNVRGDELISSSDDGTIKRWSLPERRLIDDVDLGGVETDTIAISPSGVIFAGNDEGRIIVLDGGRKRVVDAHDAGIKRVVLDHERGLLVTLSYDRTMRLWDVDGGELALADVSALPDDVWPRSCAFAGASTLVFGTFGSTYRSYDYRQREWETASIAPTLGRNAVLPAADGTYSVGDAGIVWRDEAECSRTGSLCNFLVQAGGIIVTGGQLGRVFDARTGRVLHQHRSPLNCGVRFLREGEEHIAIGAYTGEILVFRVRRGELQHVRTVQLHDNAIKGVALSGDQLFSVCADRSAVWQDARTLEPVHVLRDAHDRIANGCAALDNGWFASVSRDLRLRIWSPDYRAEIVETPHTHSIKCVAADPGARTIATGSYDGRVAIYDRGTSAWTRVERPTTAGISSLAYDPARAAFFGSSYDGSIYVIGR